MGILSEKRDEQITAITGLTPVVGRGEGARVVAEYYRRTALGSPGNCLTLLTLSRAGPVSPFYRQLEPRMFE